jgi:hypothetical protein
VVKVKAHGSLLHINAVTLLLPKQFPSGATAASCLSAPKPDAAAWHNKRLRWIKLPRLPSPTIETMNRDTLYIGLSLIWLAVVIGGLLFVATQ